MAAPATAKKTGMMWHSAVAASSAAAQARYLPVSSPRDSTPRNSTAKVSAMENENSPANVDAMLPP